MIFKINIARSGLYSATVSVDEGPIEKCDYNEGCSYYSVDLDEGYHRVEIAIRRIVKGKGEGPLTGGLNIVTGNIRDVLEDSKMVKYCYDIKVEENKDILYVNYDGKLLSSMSKAEILHITEYSRYEPEDYRGIIKFGLFFMIPLIFLVSAFCLFNGLSRLNAGERLFEPIVLLIACGFMAILGGVYLIKILMLKSILKKFTKSEDYYDKL